MPFTLSKILGAAGAALDARGAGPVCRALAHAPRRTGSGQGAASPGARSSISSSVGLFPVGNVLVLPLEERFASVPRPADDEKVAGIIILGGFEDGWVTAGRGGLAVNESAERITEGLRLALKHPEAKVVFTGGVGGLLSKDVEATGPVSQFLKDTGVARRSHHRQKAARAIPTKMPSIRAKSSIRSRASAGTW